MGNGGNSFGHNKKNKVMQDTWGHLYPEPGSKHYGEMLIAVGEYRDEVIVTSDFPGLESSPQRYAVEHTIFDRVDLEPGVYKIKCGLWFYKKSSDMFTHCRIGRLINIKVEKMCNTQRGTKLCSLCSTWEMEPFAVYCPKCGRALN